MELLRLCRENKKLKRIFFFLASDPPLKEAASNLYVLLRRIKELGYKSISITNIPNTGIGKAINDRIRRASS